MDRLTVRLDPDVKRQLDLLAAKESTSPAALAREIIEAGVMNASERAWAPLTRIAVREELDAFLGSARIAREFAADELYGSLANELRADLDDLRILVGAVLSDALERSDGDLSSLLQKGLHVGFEGTRGLLVDIAEDAYAEL